MHGCKVYINWPERQCVDMKCLKCLILFVLSTGALAGDTTFGKSEKNPASSCAEIYEQNPSSRGTIGHYYIKTCNGAQKVTCNMKLKCGGLKGGWMQVVDVDMNREGETCPGTWQNITTPGRLCQANVIGCSSAHFYMNDIPYEHVCGQVVGYQKGTPSAFDSQRSSLDSNYVEGVSITMGSPRKHVWTYAVGLSDDGNYPSWNCPCATIPGRSPPAVVGDDYYCESGDVGGYDFNAYYLTDPLWDGDGCSSTNGCCSQIGMPWFYKSLPQQDTGDFEVRICKDENHANEDIAVEKVELYVRC